MVLEIITLIALITMPILSVVIGQYLQDRSNKRKDKMDVFKAVMTFRYVVSKEGVEALNCIPIVYSDEKKDRIVRDSWKEYYKCVCIRNPDEIQIKRRNDALYKLLENMAKDLGYNDTITWEDIQNPYVPDGIVNDINNNATIQYGIAKLLSQTLETQSSDSTIEHKA